MGKDGKLLRLRLSRLQKEGEGLFCLPLGFRDVLLDIGERFMWAKTWETDAGEQALLSDADWQLIEIGLWRLTDMCEIVINNIVDVPPAQVTINNTTTCGGCSSGPSINFPELVDQNGAPIQVVCLPVDPTNPTGETPPATWDDENETPPPGWDDFTDFSNHRCIIANYSLDSFIDLINRIDEIENAISTVLDVVSLVLLILPTPLGKLRGAATVAKWIAKLRAATEAAKVITGQGEEVLDYAQIITDYIRDHKPEVICMIYEATDVFQLTEDLMSIIAGLLPEGAAGLYEKYYTAVLDYLRTMLGDILNTMYTNRAVQLIEEGYLPQINCSNCGQPVATVAKITGVAAGEVVRSPSWSNGEPLRVTGGVLVSFPSGTPAGEYWQNPTIINEVSFANSFADQYAIRLNSRTADNANRFKGYLTLNTDINSVVATGCRKSSSFGNFYVFLSANGEILLNDYIMSVPVGYTDTQYVANLPVTLPAGTICYVEFSSTAGHDEFFTTAFLAIDTFSINSSGAG